MVDDDDLAILRTRSESLALGDLGLTGIYSWPDTAGKIHLWLDPIRSMDRNLDETTRLTGIRRDRLVIELADDHFAELAKHRGVRPYLDRVGATALTADLLRQCLSVHAVFSVDPECVRASFGIFVVESPEPQRPHEYTSPVSLLTS